MGNIYLVGFMGTGKTVVGKIIAKKLKKHFVEMDEVIEKREDKKIVEIFETYGEGHFRKLEKALLGELSQKKDLVISCGGGVACSGENLKLMKRTGTLFCLVARAATIYERTRKYSHRPLLNVATPLKKIEGLLKKRLPYYKQAHYLIDTEGVSPKEVVKKILRLIE